MQTTLNKLTKDNQNTTTPIKKRDLPLLASKIAIFSLILDQITKFYMLEIYNIAEKKLVPITDFFNFVMVWNRGISFGMFQNYEYSNYVFMALTTSIVLVIFYIIKKSDSLLESIAFGLIIGGALGNLIDRILYGAVVDFLDFHYHQNHWPAFNIADSCVFIGAGILIISTLFFSSSNEKVKSKKQIESPDEQK